MKTAIIAGRGSLPPTLWKADQNSVFVTMKGVSADVPEGANVLEASFEKLGRMFSDLKDAGVEQVVMAGAMDRPRLNPARFDLKMMTLAPRLLSVLKEGDDAVLRTVISIFEGEGFKVIGPADLCPDLALPAGVMTGAMPTDVMRQDARRGREILRALGPVDVGQAVVVADGLCLGVETIQGTDALLEFVARTPAEKRGQGGVLIKWPKPAQDLRVDMPTIGPETVDQAIAAGLSGIYLAAGHVLVVNRDVVQQKAGIGGVTIWADQGPL